MSSPLGFASFSCKSERICPGYFQTLSFGNMVSHAVKKVGLLLESAYVVLCGCRQVGVKPMNCPHCFIYLHDWKEEISCCRLYHNTAPFELWRDTATCFSIRVNNSYVRNFPASLAIQTQESYQLGYQQPTT